LDREADQAVQERLRAGGNLPRHIAIIMDGNGRWARSRGLDRSEGHRAGRASVRDVVEACGQLRGIDALRLLRRESESPVARGIGFDAASSGCGPRGIAGVDGEQRAADDGGTHRPTAANQLGGAAAAGLKKLREKGVIGAEETVVVLITAHGGKFSRATVDYHSHPGSRYGNRPIRLGASLKEVERTLGLG